MPIRSAVVSLMQWAVVINCALVVVVIVAHFVWGAVVYPLAATVVCALFAGLIVFCWWFRPPADALSAADLAD